MAEITVILGSVAFFAAVFAGWYTMWHRRLATAFETVPVGTARSVHVVRRGVELSSDTE